jgi:hypothetical protein
MVAAPAMTRIASTLIAGKATPNPAAVSSTAVAVPAQNTALRAFRDVASNLAWCSIARASYVSKRSAATWTAPSDNTLASSGAAER